MHGLCTMVTYTPRSQDSIGNSQYWQWFAAVPGIIVSSTTEQLQLQTLDSIGLCDVNMDLPWEGLSTQLKFSYCYTIGTPQ